jgi:hypothetical protein
MQGTGIVDINSQRSDFKNIVFEAKDMFIGPEAKTSVLGKTVAANPRARKNNVAMSGTHLYGVYDLYKVNPIPLGKEAPFIQEC